MRVTIIPSDKRIIVDGKTVDLEDDDIRWEFDDEHIHAIQYQNGRGELEYEDVIGEQPVPNKIFDESEFDTIIQPYLEFFTEFLSAYEQRQLEEAILEEERLASVEEELATDRLERENQIATIEDLQRQNKEVRDQNDILNDELAVALEQNNFQERTAEIQQRRKDLEHQEEVSAIKMAKTEEYIAKINKHMQEKFDNLLEQFEKEKEAFLEERKMYNELLEKERLQIQAEYDNTMEQIRREDEQREEERRVSEAWELLEQENVQNQRLEMELQQKNLEEAVNELEYDIAQVRKERDMTMARLDAEREEAEEQKRLALEEIAKAKEAQDQALFEEELDKDIGDELDYLLPDNLEIFEQEYRDLQVSKMKEAERKVSSSAQAVEDIESFLSPSREDDRSIEEIVDMMTEIDPEEFYTALTDEEERGNSFPVDKAVKWFAALKEVLDREEGN